MPKQSKLPIEGKAIRFAPGRNGEPLAALWIVWAEGSEVYAKVRSSGGAMHVSVHASGQIHYRLAAKQKIDFAPAMRLGNSTWFHAFEIRFLSSDGALSPVGQRESFQKRLGHLVRTPEGFVLYANLLIGAPGSPLDGIPAISGETLWRTHLRDNRVAVLVARLFELDKENRERIRYFREEHKLSLTLSNRPTTKYAEIYDLHWSPTGGNVINVIPLWERSFRYEQELPSASATQSNTRLFRYWSSYATADLIAPDGHSVARIDITAVDEQIELANGHPKVVEVGSLTMHIEAHNLIAGSTIRAFRPSKLVCVPNLGGGSPRGWEYTIRGQFDGFRLSAEIGSVSTALNNTNPGAPLSHLDDDEEVVIRMPAEAIKLIATLDQPSTSATLLGRFTLRDRR